MVEITLQPYQYAYNNPVMFNDPTGMRGEMKGGWPPKDWWKKVTNWFNSLGGSDKETLIEEVKLYGKRTKRFSERTSEWSQINIREPLSHWFDVHTREPARKFTKPLRDAFEWTPERTAAYNQFLEVNGVNEEKF